MATSKVNYEQTERLRNLLAELQLDLVIDHKAAVDPEKVIQFLESLLQLIHGTSENQVATMPHDVVLENSNLPLHLGDIENTIGLLLRLKQNIATREPQEVWEPSEDLAEVLIANTGERVLLRNPRIEGARWFVFTKEDLKCGSKYAWGPWSYKRAVVGVFLSAPEKDRELTKNTIQLCIWWNGEWAYLIPGHERNVRTTIGPYEVAKRVYDVTYNAIQNATPGGHGA